MDFELIETGYLDRFYTQLVTAERFLQMYEDERDNIESACPVLAPLGSKMFGKILVRTKRPRYPRLPPRSSKWTILKSLFG
jgi:hypothetical protein